jgi:hypothetical protein
VAPGVIIKTSRQAANRTFPAETSECHAYGTGIADIGKKFWCEDDTPPPSIHHGNHFFINGLHDNKLDILLKNYTRFSTENKLFHIHKDCPEDPAAPGAPYPD